jgi:APA family basic amino acid/polyamine antiporter
MTISSGAALASGRWHDSEEDAAAIAGGALASAPLRKELNVFDAIAVVVGTVIGSGIFLLPSFVATQLHSLGAVLLVWLVGGVLSLFGALSLAELGSIYPGTGGLCTYLRHIYGPLPAFLYAWALLLMIHTGSIAALAVAFGIYVGQVLPLSMVEQKGLSVGLILGLTVVSCLGIRGGKLVQNLIAVAKVSGLAGIILLLSTRGSRPIRLFEGSAIAHVPAFSIAGVGIALVAVLWAYEGWHVLSFIAGEMKKPRLDLPRSLFYGSAIVMLIYLAANLGYYHVLSAAEIRGSSAVAALAVGKVLGPIGANCISILIVVSILGSMNGLILSGPRVSFAMARQGIFPAVFGRLSARYRTPVVALAVQGVWAAVLAASGSYQQLFTNVIFTAWIFYGLAVAGVLVLRRSQPQATLSFSVPGYPWLSLLFCVAAAGVILSTLIVRPAGAAIGIALVATGIPVYFFLIKFQSAIGAE